jgi:hypothetical protein
MTNRLKDPIVCLYSVLHLIKPLLESEYPEMAIRSLESPLSATRCNMKILSWRELY